MLRLEQKRRRKEIWGIIYFCILAFVVASLLSYDPADPSFNSVSTGKEVHNLIGLAGSYGADLLFQTFGLSAYLLLLPLIFLIIQFFFPTDMPRKGLRLFGFMLLIIFSAGLFSLVFNTITINHQRLLAGGLIGHLLTSLLLPYFNRIGSYIIMLGGVVSNIVLSFNVSIASALKIFGFCCVKLLSTLGIIKHIPAVLRRKKIDGIAFQSSNEISESIPEITEVSEEPVVAEDPLPETDEQRECEEDLVPDEPPDEVFADDPLPPPPEMDMEPEEAETLPDNPSLPQQPPYISKKKKIKKLSVDYFIPQGTYTLPKIDLIADTGTPRIPVDREVLIQNSRILEQKLRDFSVDGRVVEVRPGPVITVYEFEPAPGVKVSKILNLSDDLALALRAASVRILAPIPGKSVVGIELPNEQRNIVYLREILNNNEFRSLKYRLPIALGKSISGEPMIADLSRMPHLLVAGSTGAGKSVFLNSVICSLLFRFTPDQLRFLMIDPKMLELSMYEHIPHLLLPVVTDPKKAAVTLKWAVEEMDRRYHLMSKLFVRNVDSYNKKLEESSEDDLNMLLKEESDDIEEQNPSQYLQKLPYIVIVIDELADLMMVASKEVELAIARLAQMARAAGIHLLVATQRPSVDVLTGLIKANFPARIAFQVSSRIDSRTILDHMGAEKLLGNGDMLYSPPGTSKVKRIHGAFVSDTEVKKLVQFLKDQGEPLYDNSILTRQVDDDEAEYFDEDDALYQEAVDLVSKARYASISMIQRRLRIGYNRAARMIEQMETEGIVGHADGAKPREVLVKT